MNIDIKTKPEAWKRLDDAFSNFINGYGDPYEPKEAHEAETAKNLKELYEAFNAYRMKTREIKTFINLNARVRVKLTEHGKIILAMDEYATEKPDENGFLELHLWELMRVFGSVMFMGNPNLPFENMNVELLG